MVMVVLDSRLYDGGNGDMVLLAGLHSEADSDLEFGLDDWILAGFKIWDSRLQPVNLFILMGA